MQRHSSNIACQSVNRHRHIDMQYRILINSIFQTLFGGESLNCFSSSSSSSSATSRLHTGIVTSITIQFTLLYSTCILFLSFHLIYFRLLECFVRSLFVLFLLYSSVSSVLVPTLRLPTEAIFIFVAM